MNLSDQATLPGTARVQPLRGVGICLILAVMAMVIPLVEHAYLYPLVLLLLACFVVPIWYGWVRGDLDFFEPIHIFGFVYFIFFGLGAVWTVQDPSTVAYDPYIVPYVPKAVLYCLLGYLCLLAGYYLPWKGKVSLSSQEQVRGVMFILIIAGLGIVGYLAVRVAERAAALGIDLTAAVGSMSQLSPLFLFAWGLAWLLYFSGKATQAQRWLLFAVLIPGALLTAYSTFSDKSLVMTLVGVPIIARWYAKRRIPWTFLLVMLLILVFVIFPFYNTYRWSDPNMDQTSRLMATYQTVQAWDSITYMKFSLGTFKRRLAMINSVAVVVRDVGRWEPYAKGETIFKPIGIFFIPRVIWPDKPQTALGKDFGRRFRVTDARNPDVFIGVTAPGEFYWNFDLPGILVGMGLMGLAMRWLYRRYGESDELDPVRRAIHILLLVQVAHLVGSAQAPALVAIIRTLIVIEGLRWIGRNFGLIDLVAAGDPAPVQEALPPSSAPSPAR